MANEIKRDTVDYRDPTPFDNSKLKSLSEISQALRHKTYGADTREAMAQQGEALAKLMQETGGNQSAEVAAARGPFELLGIRESAQEEAIKNNQLIIEQKADKNYINDYFGSITYAPTYVANYSELTSNYPAGKPGLFIAADSNRKYMWVDGAWKDFGEYPTQGILDRSIKGIKIANKTVTSHNVSDININDVVDSYAAVGSAHAWLSGGNEPSVNGQVIGFNNTGGDNGVIVDVMLDRLPVGNEMIYINFDYASQDTDGLTGDLEVYAMDLDGNLKSPAMIVTPLGPSLQHKSYGMVADLFKNWELKANFKLVFVIHGVGNLIISGLLVNKNNTTRSLQDKVNRIMTEQLGVESVTDEKISSVDAAKISNTRLGLADFKPWFDNEDTLIIGANGLIFTKKIAGDNGIIADVNLDTTQDVYVTMRAATTAPNVDLNVMDMAGSIKDNSFSFKYNESLDLYTTVIPAFSFKNWGITSGFKLLLAVHQEGSYLRLTDISVSNSNGLATQLDNNNNVFGNVGIQKETLVGQDLSGIEQQDYIDAHKVHYSTFDAKNTVPNAILKYVEAYVSAEGFYKFQVANIDQHGLIVNGNVLNLKMTKGFNHLDLESFNIHVPIGAQIFMDIAESKYLYTRSNARPKLMKVLIQDEDNQSSVPGYPGMMMYESEFMLPFNYTVAEKSQKQQLNEVNKSVADQSNAIRQLETAQNGDVFVKAASGKKFRLVVDDNGNLLTDSLLPNKVAIFGNSLTKEHGGIGMCASDKNHDWYHYVTEYIESKNNSVKFNERANVSSWEAATTSSARQAVFNEQIEPALSADTDLVIIQLVDNVNSEDRMATFAEDCKTLLKNIHLTSPKAKVYWVAGWFVDQNKLDIISAACSQNNATLVNISSLFSDVSNRGTMGMTRTGIDGTNWQVAIEGEALHPGDKGMRLIADAVIGKLGF